MGVATLAIVGSVGSAPGVVVGVVGAAVPARFLHIYHRCS